MYVDSSMPKLSVALDGACPFRSPPQKLSTNRDPQSTPRAAYPEDSDSNSSSINSQTTTATLVATKKRVDFAPLNTNSLPPTKSRGANDPIYQRLYPNGNNKINGNGHVNNTANNDVDDENYYIRPYRNMRSLSNGEYIALR